MPFHLRLKDLIRLMCRAGVSYIVISYLLNNFVWFLVLSHYHYKEKVFMDLCSVFVIHSRRKNRFGYEWRQEEIPEESMGFAQLAKKVNSSRLCN